MIYLRINNISQNVMLGDDFNVNLRFESFVNLEWCKTRNIEHREAVRFESFVNLEWCKTT